MFDFADRCYSLADLLTTRSSLRQQETVLKDALHDVQQELRSWHQHRRELDERGLPSAPELVRLWAELAEREHQLVLDLLQLQHLRQQISEEVTRLVHRRREKAG
jgi:uncharacterized protein involved in exopolysaccharide biosynthesis